MSKTTKIVLAIVSLMFVGLISIGVWFTMTYIHYSDMGNRLEVTLVAKHKNLENVLSSGYQQISGVAQVTEMARDDLKEVFVAAITAREGEDGSKAVFKMITESNPNVDPSLYREVQRVVQATKQEYQAEQTAFLTQKAQYQEVLGQVWAGFWLKLVGRPKIDLDSLKIATTGAAAKALETGVEEEIKLRK